MVTSQIPPCRKDRFRPRRRRASGRHGPQFRPRLDAFEDRVLLSTVTWDGGAGTSNWSEAANWQGNVAPVPGDDLVFPGDAAQKTNFNNFPSGTSFHSLKFTGSGYTISGGSLNMLTIDPSGGLSNRAESGTNEYFGPVQLAGAGFLLSVGVSPGGSLVLGGAISGSGGLSIGGGGTLTLAGADANTYTGTTLITRGLLQLNKHLASGLNTAIPGDLKIVAPSIPNTIITSEVRLLGNRQIALDAKVTIEQTTSSVPVFNSNGFSNVVGALNMTGGRFDGPLVFDFTNPTIINGDLTAQAAQLDTGSSAAFAPAVIDGILAVVPGHHITVNKQPGSQLGLEVGTLVAFDPTSGGAGLTKDGAGTLSLTSAGLSGGRGLVIGAGTVSLGPNVFWASGDVTLSNDGVLGGTGGVTGSVTTQDGVVRTLDDPVLSGSPVPRWTTSTGRGFGSDFSSVGPATAVGAQTASWFFTGLTPGVYRVFGTWVSGANRSTRAPFSLFDGSVVRGTAVVNQEQAPRGGPHAGGVVFQQLGGTVKIASGVLVVQLSNAVPDETSGALVVADAIRIERLAGILSPGDENATSSSTFEVDTQVTLGPGSTYQVNFVNNAPGVDSVVPLAVGSSLGSSPGLFFTSDTLLALSASSFSPPSPGTAFHIINRTGGSGVFDNAPNDGDTIELLAGGQRHIFSINYHAGDGNDVDLIYQNTATQVRDLKLSPDVILAGQRVVLSGALTDPNPGDRLTLRVDWGDGTVKTFRHLGTRPFRLRHTYAHSPRDGAPYEVRVTWFDQHGAGNSATLFVTVNKRHRGSHLAAARWFAPAR